jgi:hypothetical protein
MKKKEVQTGRPSQRATFADVARMIAPFNMPPWLPAHLEWWAQGIRHDRMVDQYRPTTSQTVERLSEVVEALRVLERNLSDSNIRNLLEFASIPNKIKLPIATLKDLADRAEAILSSPVLTGKDGKTKRGHGKPTVRLLAFPMRTGGCCQTVDREISRFPRKERLHMPGSLTTPGRPNARDDPRMTRGQCGSLLLHCNGHARHARKADDVVGFQTGQCCRGHFRKGGVARVLHHGDATALLECR